MKMFIKQNMIWCAFFASSIVMLVITVVASMMMMSYAETIEETSKKNILSLSRAAALLATADELDQFMDAEDMALPAYKALNEKLRTFNDTSDTEYTYFLRLVEDENREEMLSLAGKHILVVEDVETNQIIIQDILERYGAEVKMADDGLEGYNEYIANPDKYALILMDIQMPVLDGYDAAKRIRSSDCENAAVIPIVAMTANVYKEDVEQAKECGMNDHIGKPFDISQIERVFIRLFEKQ